MFQLIGSFMKYTLFALGVLVAAHLITVEGRTLSGHVQEGLRYLALSPMSLPDPKSIGESASETAVKTTKSIRRAWNGLPEVSIQYPGRNLTDQKKQVSNPHDEKHSSESRKDLNEMLQTLRNQKVSIRE